MIKLCVFDMDGLLIDSEIVFLESVKIIEKEYGYSIPLDLQLSIMGKNETAIKEMFMERMGNDFDYDLYDTRRVEARSKYIEENSMELKKGVKELFNYLDANNIKKALATSSDREKTYDYLKEVGIDKNTFDHIVCGNDLSESKPHPQIYLKAIEPFNINKDEIFAFEDSNNGILSAYNAGLRVIHIPDLAFVSDDTKNKACKVLNDLSEAIDIIESENKGETYEK